MLILNHVNFIKLTFGLMSAFVFIVGALTNLCEKILPDSIKQSYRFGKFSFQGKTTKLVSMFEVPKAYFQHFYSYSASLMLIVFGFTLGVYLFNVPIPEFVNRFLDLIGGIDRTANVSATHVITAQFLLTTQCVRRFYDTSFVSVFSKHSKMNLSHYLAGFIHYTGCAVAVLLEAPLFANGKAVSASVNFSELSKLDVLAAVIFLAACYQQFMTSLILARLRKDSSGKILTDKHKLPHGGLFKYLSSPHMNCEITMYITLTIILWGNSSWLYILSWVLLNQTEVILLNHWWYKSTFSNFPQDRKALIPFVY